MPKQIPKVFVNTIDKEIKNNDTIFYSKKQSKKERPTNKEEIPDSISYSEADIKRKVMKIFNSPSFVYKMKVEIKTKDDKLLEKELIAMVNDTLLTLDEDKISISNIKDIKEKTT